jgi:hypothetical protein
MVHAPEALSRIPGRLGEPAAPAEVGATFTEIGLVELKGVVEPVRRHSVDLPTGQLTYGWKDPGC